MRFLYFVCNFFSCESYDKLQNIFIPFSFSAHEVERALVRCVVRERLKGARRFNRKSIFRYEGFRLNQGCRESYYSSESQESLYKIIWEDKWMMFEE